MQRKIYIDAGSFKADTINMYSFPEYRRYAFECNPLLRSVKYPEDVIVINKAIWVEDRYLEFFINPNNLDTEGCSLFKNKMTGDLDKENYLIVETINFSDWLMRNISITDYVILKMNIEGAEYMVLKHLIATKAIIKIHELFVYWHVNKIKSIEDNVHKTLVKDLEKIFGDNLHSFY